MKKALFPLLLFFLFLNIFAIEKVEIKKNDYSDYLSVLDENEVLFYQVTAIDADEDNHLYFLAYKLGCILKIDFPTATLVKTIASKGQGPAELDVPLAFKVRNKKIFVLDSGFSGVKIFGTDGKLINEFKTLHRPRWLDVSPDEKIFVNESESDATPVIALYDAEGKRLKSLIRFPMDGKVDRLKISNQRHFVFAIDNNSHILVLNNRKRTLQKYDNKGRMLWSKYIDNEILEKFSKREKKPHFDSKGNIRTKPIVQNSMAIDGDNNIIVSHMGGGMLFDPEGAPKKLVYFEKYHSYLGTMKIFNDNKTLINSTILGGEIVLLDYSKIIR